MKVTFKHSKNLFKLLGGMIGIAAASTLITAPALALLSSSLGIPNQAILISKGGSGSGGNHSGGHHSSSRGSRGNSRSQGRNSAGNRESGNQTGQGGSQGDSQGNNSGNTAGSQDNSQNGHDGFGSGSGNQTGQGGSQGSSQGNNAASTTGSQGGNRDSSSRAANDRGDNGGLVDRCFPTPFSRNSTSNDSGSERNQGVMTPERSNQGGTNSRMAINNMGNCPAGGIH